MDLELRGREAQLVASHRGMSTSALVSSMPGERSGGVVRCQRDATGSFEAMSQTGIHDGYSGSDSEGGFVARQQAGSFAEAHALLLPPDHQTDCAALNEVRPREAIRCKECGHRVLYKQRTKRMVSSVHGMRKHLGNGAEKAMDGWELDADTCPASTPATFYPRSASLRGKVDFSDDMPTLLTERKSFSQLVLVI